MGGNALKNTTTRRYEAEEYHNLVPYVEGILRDILPAKRVKAIPAYSSKPSYGDMDVLVEGPLPSDFRERILKAFNPNELVVSGPVVSFDVKELQVDVIKASTDEYEFSMHYYSYNDLGNFLGKIAHKFGVKYGHDGVFYIHREQDHIIKEILLTQDPDKALSFLGLDPKEYKKEFDSLESVFRFVASSPYFNPGYYLLDETQKNATDRVRINKRKSYQQFLSWLEANRASLPQYVPVKDKSHYFEYIQKHFPHFQSELENSVESYELKKAEDAQISAKFNVDIVKTLVSSDKMLNKVMQQFNNSFASKYERREWLLRSTPEMIMNRLHQAVAIVGGA